MDALLDLDDLNSPKRSLQGLQTFQKRPLLLSAKEHTRKSTFKRFLYGCVCMMFYRAVTDQYALATHTVKVRRSGMLSDVSVLWDTSKGIMVTGSAQAQMAATKLKIERLPSINCFNQACNP